MINIYQHITVKLHLIIYYHPIDTYHYTVIVCHDCYPSYKLGLAPLHIWLACRAPPLLWSVGIYKTYYPVFALVLCIFAYILYMYVSTHAYGYMYIYIILCTCHISMLYRYVGMCDKHERSIHMLSMLYKPKNSLVRAHAFCWEAHWVASQYACHSSMPGGHNFFRNDSNHMSSSMVHILGPWHWSVGGKPKLHNPLITDLDTPSASSTSDFSHQSVMGMPWRNKRSDLCNVGRLESGCGVIWCHKAW